MLPKEPTSFIEVGKRMKVNGASRFQCPLISVIVLNYNGKKYLKKCFNSLEQQTYPYCEIILIDNASTDGSVKYVKEKFPSVKIIQNKENLGYAEANNKATEIAKGKYLFFLNNDTWIEQNTVEELVQTLGENEKIGACAPQIRDYEGIRRISLGVGCDIFGYPSSTATGKVFYVDGAALFIRNSIFDEIGGFDDRYFVFHEDVDLSWRLRLYGYEIATNPRAIVYHVSGGTLVGGVIKNRGGYTTTIRRRYLGEKNNICNLLKNYSLLTLLVILPLHILINLGELLVFLSTGKIKVLRAYMNAWLWNVKNLKVTLEWRRRVQKRRRISDREIMRKMYKGCIKFNLFMQVGVPEFR